MTKNNDQSSDTKDDQPKPTGKLFFSDAKGRPCKPKDAWMWTWEGADKWWFTRTHPVPDDIKGVH